MLSIEKLDGIMVAVQKFVTQTEAHSRVYKHCKISHTLVRHKLELNW